MHLAMIKIKSYYHLMRPMTPGLLGVSELLYQIIQNLLKPYSNKDY